MHQKKKAFLEILIIELEDLDEDIKLLIDQSNKKLSSHELSDYVNLENIAVLQNELFGVEGFIEEIKKIDPEKFDNLDSLIDGINDMLKKRIKEKGAVHSIELLVDRKCNKVKRYINHDQN